ncbi:MAG TPA: hypothetical protein VFV08_08060 [Puia sp.]|nr:hypothetical protein [Puia sp.]
MHIDFDPHKINWSLFIISQQTGDVSKETTQFGGSTSPTHGPGSYYGTFSGMPYQRGTGIGSVFRSLWRFLIPLGREAGRELGKQGLVSGVRALSSVLEGEKSLKNALADEGKAGLKNLLDKASSNLEKRKHEAQEGAGFDFKRYKKAIATAPVNDHAPPSTVGLFTARSTDDATLHTTPPLLSDYGRNNNHKGNRKYINSKRKSGIKHPKYRSLIGPQAINSKLNTKKRLRVDALGPY